MNPLKKPTWKEMLLQHIIVFSICIVFPGLTTLIAPASWLTFQRSDHTVTCKASTCVFFILPFKSQTVYGVTSISHREKSGSTYRQRRQGRETDKVVHQDGEGFLTIHGEDQSSAEISVSPASLPHVVDKCNAFLASRDRQSATFFAIANWKFGAIMGGVLSCFTALYVVGYSMTLLNTAFRMVRRLLRG